MKLKFIPSVYCDDGFRDFICYNSKNERLGEVFWDSEWKCSCWAQEPDIKMSYDCMMVVAEFLKNFNKKKNFEGVKRCSK